MSSNVTAANFRRLNLHDIQFYDNLYSFDDPTNSVRFTPKGDAYYRYWFRRFGFRFDGIDPDTFITTVRDIGRLLFDDSDHAAQANEQSPEERALWSLLEEGRHEEFTQALLELAEKRKASGAQRVVALPSRS
jgi:hypothetical protein